MGANGVPTHLTPEARRLRGQLAINRRHGNDTTEIERDYAAETLAEHVARVLSTAPKLTDGQRDRITALLRGGAL